MLQQTTMQKLRNDLKFKNVHSFSGLDIFEVDKKQFKEEIKKVKCAGFSLLLDITAIDYLDFPTASKERFAAVYLFRNLETFEEMAFKVFVSQMALEIDSVCDEFLSANWMEREVYDQYGVIFKGHPNLKRLLNHCEFEGYPLRKDYPIDQYQLLHKSDALKDEMGKLLQEKGYIQNADDLIGTSKLSIKNRDLQTDLMFINIGPSHPASHGTIRNLMAMDGEKIVSCVSEIGYLHRGFEKSCETHTYNQIIPYTDRLNYCSAIINNVAFSKTIEEILNIKLPDRAIFMRVILCELSRIIDHLVCLAALLVDSGALTNFWYLFNPREEVYNFLSRLTGARLTNSFTRIGGMAYDFHESWEIELQDCLKKVDVGLGDTLKLIAHNKIFLDRVQDICKISKKDAIGWGFTGPVLRASGVDYDMRKDKPYYYYETFDFEVPVGSCGDIYDRVFVRVEEIHQSIKIVQQAIQRIPQGPVDCNDASVILPQKRQVYDSIEGVINQFKVVYEGVKVPISEHYSAIEAANGELGFFVVSDGSGKPYKVKVKPPCFQAMASYAKTVEGHLLADAILNLGSLNIIAGELDR